MHPEPDHDEVLMAQAANGNHASLEALIRRYAGPLLTFLARKLGDRHDGEELFQETFLAVWTKRKQYQFPRSFKAWLFAIAVNKCRESYRGRDKLKVGLAADDPPASAETAPDEKMLAEEKGRLVMAALAELPPQQRLVVTLRVWNGLSYAEIADSVGRTEATVRSHMHHALAALRRYLEPRLREN